MINLKRVLIVQMAFLSVAFAGNGPLDDGTDVCGVPVCDLSSTATALVELNENQRYNYTNKLVISYAESQEIEILENLVVAAKTFRTVSEEAGDADWVTREASTLLNNSVFNLAKYSDISAANLTDLFSQLDNQTKRFEVISYWQNKMSEIENLKDLSALVEFSLMAVEISAAAGDEDWVPRAANALASSLTIKLTDLDPAHEGVYSVKIDDNDTNAPAFDKVVILDSSSEKNLVVRFINSKYKRVAFEYTNASLVGTTISAKRISSGSLSSQVELKIDRATGDITGSIQTTTQAKIKFQGTQNFSSRTIFAGEVPYALSENTVIGEMTGILNGIKGTMSVRSFSPGVYSAHFVADNGFIVLDFLGKFFPKTGVLSLTHDNKVKLVLALPADGSDTMWSGQSFSIVNGKVNNASFTSN